MDVNKAGTCKEIPSSSPAIESGCCLIKKTSNYSLRNPLQVYFEGRGKSCKKLLKFNGNGNTNKILLYPEEGWARSTASSYWTITLRWWQPNHCIIEEISLTQKFTTKARIITLDKSSILILGTFKKKIKDGDFKLYLTSSISIQDYNMGYCLTGFIERKCHQTNTFQMTHFAVIRRQWPSIQERKF